MNEATLLIVLGLVFDIFGAFLIIEPILTRFVRIDSIKQRGAATSNIRDKTRTDPDYEQKSSRQAWWGFGCLAFGFLLQIIGNLIQNPLF